MIPRNRNDFEASSGKTFAVPSALCYLLDAIDDATSWKQKVNDLLEKHNDIELDKPGFPEDWQTMPPWCNFAGNAD